METNPQMMFIPEFKIGEVYYSPKVLTVLNQEPSSIVLRLNVFISRRRHIKLEHMHFVVALTLKKLV